MLVLGYSDVADLLAGDELAVFGLGVLDLALARFVRERAEAGVVITCPASCRTRFVSKK